MAKMDVLSLRNVALLSHSGAGKTTLSEALLFNLKAVSRMGRVEDGNTVSDHEPEEAKRGSSIQTTLIPCVWDDVKVNFLDTPGYDDFLSEVIGALRVVESAVILISAPSSVDVGTERSWRMSKENSLPRMFLIQQDGPRKRQLPALRHRHRSHLWTQMRAFPVAPGVRP